MQTEQRTKKIRVQVERAAPVVIDPESLWLDTNIEPEELIRLDPLEFTYEMEQQAERPELADFVLQSLRERKFVLHSESWR